MNIRSRQKFDFFVIHKPTSSEIFNRFEYRSLLPSAESKFHWLFSSM